MASSHNTTKKFDAKIAWSAGEPQPLPTSLGEHIELDPSGLISNYKLCISAVVPRPIALVSTCGEKEGDLNLAPYSYFNVMSHDPPTVAIGMCRMKGPKQTPKDSLRNILATKEFVVNIMNEWYLESANHSCGDFPPEVSEWNVTGLKTLPSKKVTPPRCASSACHMECKLIHTYDVKNASGLVTTTIIIGQIVMWHVVERLLDDNANPSIRFEGYKPVSRLGGNDYSLIDASHGVKEIPRPKV